MVGHDYGYIGLYHENGRTQIRTYMGKVTAEKYKGEAWEACVFQREAEGEVAWIRLSLREDKTYVLSYSFDGKTPTRSTTHFHFAKPHGREQNYACGPVQGKIGSRQLVIMIMWRLIEGIKIEYRDKREVWFD